ncbi:MAG: DUF222 domain-containing protein [Jatrophihabitantaceae bacterium]
MTATDVALHEWDFLPPLDDAALPQDPPDAWVLVAWPEPAAPAVAPAVVFADSADAARCSDAALGSDDALRSDDAIRSKDTLRSTNALRSDAALREGLAWRQPGLAEITRLASLDFHELSPAERINAAADLQRQQAWLAARQLSLLSLISAHDSTQKHWCVEEVGCALGLAGRAAQNLLKNAEQLCRQLPATLSALSEGRISVTQATAITEASYPLPDEVLADYQSQVLKDAHQQSTAQLTRAAKRAALRLDPASAELRHQRSMSDRHIRIAPAGHGTSWLMALLPAAQAHLLYDRVDAAARMAPGDDGRTLDQLRADALVNAVLNGIDGELPTAQGHRPAINVTISLSSLTGQSDEPGWLDGYGPITAGYARQLAHDPTGTWRRLITDPVSGQLLDYGVTRYRPPRHLGDHVIERDGECAFPFCAHRARRSDLDHVVAYPRGSTSAANLQPLHRRHHNAKTEAGWQVQRDHSTDSTQWTSPSGRKYRAKPPERWPRPVAESHLRGAPPPF